jgi:uncharacterized protein YutE (UPF0331/DUF86 family)
MLDALRNLPISSVDEFAADERNPAAAESFLRRALEGLLDLGRHILAKGFGEGVLEYKAMADRLLAHGVLSETSRTLLTQMAGYRNRLTHFYSEIADEELRTICDSELGDIEVLLEEILAWLRAHPERLDRAL